MVLVYSLGNALFNCYVYVQNIII